MTYTSRFTAAFILLAAFQVKANVCGTDYQNFNATTNGLGFVTVHSSETLSPCSKNFGVYLNYALNSMTYSRTLNANLVSGQKQKDKILGSDLTFGMGITDRWDFGFSLPGVLSIAVEDDYNVATFENVGITEFKINTKYRLYTGEKGGLAGIFSINKNLVENNPFSGANAGLTFNFELAVDRMINETWSIAGNIGYRHRNKGTQLAGVPFVPLDDQYIYSVAAGYNVRESKHKLVAEIYGGRAATPLSLDTDRALSSFEGLLGDKYTWNKNVTVDFGFSKQLDNSLGGPESRIYAGFTWTTDPCPPPPVSVAPAPVVVKEPEVYHVDSKILFANNSDNLDLVDTKELNEVIKKIAEQNYDRIVIEGNTDSYGTKDYNMDLSLRRANRIRRYMVKNFGMDANKISIVGNGYDKPVKENTTKENRLQNRRVEIKVWLLK